MPPESRKHRALKVMGCVALSVVVLFVLVLLRILTLWRSESWRSFDSMPETMIRQHMDMANDTLEEWLAKINRKDGHPYAVTFTQHEINACCKCGLTESEKVPRFIREGFKGLFVTMKPGVLAFSLKSGLFGVGTVTIAVAPTITESGYLCAELRYAKLGALPIPKRVALRILRRLTQGTKVDGLFSGQEIDPADIYIPLIVVQIDSLEIGEGAMTIRGRIK